MGMRRYHVHCTVDDPIWLDADPVITVTLDAIDDAMAELNARALITAPIDVQEIEEDC
jgi:hypothetical protein